MMIMEACGRSVSEAAVYGAQRAHLDDEENNWVLGVDLDGTDVLEHAALGRGLYGRRRGGEGAGGRRHGGGAGAATDGPAQDTAGRMAVGKTVNNCARARATQAQDRVPLYTLCGGRRMTPSAPAGPTALSCVQTTGSWSYGSLGVRVAARVRVGAATMCLRSGGPDRGPRGGRGGWAGSPLRV